MEKLVPKLRFPEFQGNWEEKKLKNVSNYFNGGSFENDVKEEGRYELITLKSVDMSGNLAHSKRYLDIEVPTLKKGTLVMILSEQSPGLLGMTAIISEENKYVLNQRVAEIRPKSDVVSYFLSMAINRNQKYFSKHGAGTKVQNISKPNVENYTFLCPQPEEQQKIASFLTSVDERLTLLAQQKEKLELYKKGVMQQIFSQKLRFKDENGKEYPDWEEKKLGDICKLQGGFAFKSNEFKETGIPVIRISNISNHTNHIDLNSIVFYNKIEKDENFTIKKGDLIIAMSGATTGKSSIYNLEYYAYLNQRVGLFKSLTNKLEYNFLIQFVFSDLFKKQLDSLLVAGAQPNISSKDIESLFIPFPVIEEQKKIASFLSAIDVQIEGVSKKIEQTKMFKKGLLQQMFV